MNPSAVNPPPEPTPAPAARPVLTEMKYSFAELVRELQEDRNAGTLDSELLSQSEIVQAFAARKGKREQRTD